MSAMNKLRKGIRLDVLRIVLLMIFSLYVSSITFFTHSHIVGGVTIVHSHFYTANDDGTPAHEHTGSQIQLIQTLSTFFSFEAIVLAILIGFFASRVYILFVERDCFRKQDVCYGQSRLRAPPGL